MGIGVGMEKDKEVCVLSKDRFEIYWKLLLLNYNQKNTHEMQQKYKLFYSVFKDVEENDFKIAVKKAIQYQQYFPNVNEVYKYLPTTSEKIEQKLKDWENIQAEKTSEEEQEELKKLLKI